MTATTLSPQAQKLRVAFTPQPQDYDIVIDNGLLAQAGAHIRERLGARRCLIVTDENVAPLYLAELEDSLGQAGLTLLPSIIIPAGEPSKSLPGIHELMNHIFDRGVDRGSLLIALGGGVVGDLTGYAASITMRGIDFMQVPTTLLAQVDSSVGGKTGINSIYGKNTVGTFYQPRLVLADVKTLETLPVRELKSGYAETVKYGLIMDPAFYDWCEANGKNLIEGDAAARIYAIGKSCAYKAKIVEEDEREAGRRALLNLGHTFAHPMESLTGYSDTLLHGEAVAIGTLMAFQLSANMGLCPAHDVKRIEAHFTALGLPTRPPVLNEDIEQFMTLMGQDKKARDGQLTLILAKGIGQSFVAKGVDPAPIRALWRSFLA